MHIRTPTPQDLADIKLVLEDTELFPPELLEAHPDRVWGIPTSGGVRSLNLSNAVSIVIYEALRQTGALQRTFVE